MLALAVSAPFLTRALGRDAGYPLAAGFAAGGLVVATQAKRVLAGRPVQADLPWIPGLGVRLHLTLDGLALVFALLVLGVGVLVMTYSALLRPGHPAGTSLRPAHPVRGVDARPGARRRRAGAVRLLGDHHRLLVLPDRQPRRTGRQAGHPGAAGHRVRRAGAAGRAGAGRRRRRQLRVAYHPRRLRCAPGQRAGAGDRRADRAGLPDQVGAGAVPLLAAGAMVADTPISAYLQRRRWSRPESTC